MGCDCMLPPYSVRCREPDGWRFHDHVAQMTDMLDLHLNAIPLLHKQRRVALFTHAAVSR